MAAPPPFTKRMKALHEAAGRPTLRVIVRWAEEIAEPGVAAAPRQATISEWLNGRSIAADWATLELVLTVLKERAEKAGVKPEPADLYRLAAWRAAYERARVDTATATVYQGLAAFDRGDADRFYGRGDDIAALRDRLDGQCRSGGLLAVLAPSGTGKSSLLAAGLLPEIERAGLPTDPGATSWPAVIITPGLEPLAALTASVPSLGAVVRGALADAATVKAATADHIDVVAGPEAKLILIVDQFEEVFQADPAERDQFVEALAAIASGGRALVLFAARDDFYPDLRRIPALREALSRPFNVDPMTAEQLRDAIVKPAAAAGLNLDTDLVRRMLNDAGLLHASGEPTGADVGGQLPLVSHALRVMHDRGALTSKNYNKSGGIAGAVAETAKTAWTRLCQRGLDQVALGILVQLVRVDADRQDTRRRVDKPALLAATASGTTSGNAADDAAEALTILTDARLVTYVGTSVQITHEALLREWSQLRDAIDAERADHVIRQDIERRARQWDEAGRPPERLYRGTELQLAHRLVTKHQVVNTTALDFLAAADQQERLQLLRRRRLLIAAVSAVILIIGAGAVAVVEGISDARETERAVFTEVVAQADRLRDTDTSLAAQLYLTAYRMQPTPALYTSLLETENEPLSRALQGHVGIVRAISDDGATLASAGDDGTIQLWSAAPTPALLARITQTGRTTAVVLTDGGTSLISADDAGTVRLWNITDRAHPVAVGVGVPAGVGHIWGLAVSPDGRTLAVAGSDGTARLLTIADRVHPMVVRAALSGTGRMLYGTGITFSPDGRTLAAAGAGGTVRLWNVIDPTHPVELGAPLPGGSRVTYAVAFSETRNLLVSAGGDTVLRLWGLADPAHPTLLAQPVTAPGGSILSVAVSPDGDTVTLWNISDPTHPIPLGKPLTGHTRGVGAVMFSPDGRTLVTGSADSTVRLWALPPTRLVGFAGDITSVVFSHSGRTLAVSSADKTVRLWDTTNPESPVPAGPGLLRQDQPGFVNTVAVNRDDTVLAAGGDGKTVRLWNTADPNRATRLGPDLVFPSEVGGLAFSPDGRILAVGCGDGSVRLFTMADPAHPAPLGAALMNTPNELVGAVKFNPAGTILASAGADHKIWLWDMTDPAVARPAGLPLERHTDQVYQLAFSPDGTTLASVGADHTARLWNLSDPAHAQERGRPLQQQTNAIGGVAYSPDGKTLATGSDDQTVVLWDVTDPAHASAIGQPVTGHTSFIYTVGFSPDSHTLVSGGRDHTVLLWQLDIDRAIGRVCASTSGDLTPQVWTTYVSRDRRYDPPCGGA